ncbi:DUF5908 family protein [Aliifodinibius salicampi]|uniref:DUF5908 family protein n=1 Tax=Fodinibius salicampi TaxID=1920655 RepID=A0ABT3PZ31_9BACT|nr:DUF5908 family protein [Fodinibius salicampi]MCW9713088.1 DUF5908 family protein [Fodinibius salicampi]
MPIEIKELHIKVNVEEPSPERSRSRPGRRPPQATGDRDNLVDLCVEKVLEVLKQKNRR